MEEQCSVQALRIVALIAAVLTVGELSLPEEKWLVALGSVASLAWLLEALGDKANLANMSAKGRVEQDMFKTAFVNQIVYNAVYQVLTNSAFMP